MHRKKYMWGYLCPAFGLGLLVGMWIESGFWAHCIGFGLLFYGVSQLCKK